MKLRVFSLRCAASLLLAMTFSSSLMASAVVPDEALSSSVAIELVQATEADVTTVSLIQEGERSEMRKRVVDIRVSNNLFISLGIVPAQVRAVLSGERAPTRLATQNPVFEVFIPSDMYAPDFIYIARLSERRGRRQVSVARMSTLTGDNSGGIRENDRIALYLEELQEVEVQDRDRVQSYTQYRVTPVEPISSGEYALMISESTLTPAATSGFYDFGVD